MDEMRGGEKRGYELERQHVSPSDCISLRITGLLVAMWVVI